MDNLEYFVAKIATLKKVVIDLKGESIFRNFEKENSTINTSGMVKGKAHEN